MPFHSHVPRAAATGTGNAPTGNVWASLPGGYATPAGSNLDAACVSVVGGWAGTREPGAVGRVVDRNYATARDSTTMAPGGRPYDNWPQYLTLTFIIALAGICPSRP